MAHCARVAVVAPAVVDGDTNGLGQSAIDASGLELLQGESPSGAHLDVVLVGGAPDHGPEGLDRPGGDRGGLGHPGATATLLPRRLVEPRLDVALPVLVEVRVRHHLVALGRHLGGWRWPGKGEPMRRSIRRSFIQIHVAGKKWLKATADSAICSVKRDQVRFFSDFPPPHQSQAN